MGYELGDFVRDLRRIAGEAADDRTIVTRVGPLARELALGRTWVEPRHYQCDRDQGFGVHPLFEGPDHALWVIAASWLPGRGTPPHDHGTWAIVTGVDGPEVNVFWKRVDDGSRPGYAELQRQGEGVFGPGDVVSFFPQAIHSVENRTDAVTVSLHVYGRHLNHVARSQFDPAARTRTPITLVVQ
jgi:predicted metal-dependent enzyme (double-stranded beta helix superfamily)